MLYIIGGAPRSGKTELARMLLKERGIPYFSADYLTSGFHHGLPEFGVFHEQDSTARAEKLWPILKCMLKSIAIGEREYTVEGDIFQPRDIAALMKECKSVRTCFLGYPDVVPQQKIKHIRNFPGESNNWTAEKPDDEILALIEEGAKFSAYLKEECKLTGLDFFDTATSFRDAVTAAAGRLNGSVV